MGLSHHEEGDPQLERGNHQTPGQEVAIDGARALALGLQLLHVERQTGARQKRNVGAQRCVIHRVMNCAAGKAASRGEKRTCCR